MLTDSIFKSLYLRLNKGEADTDTDTDTEIRRTDKGSLSDSLCLRLREVLKMSKIYILLGIVSVFIFV